MGHYVFLCINKREQMSTIPQIIYPISLFLPILLLFIGAIVLRYKSDEKFSKIITAASVLGIFASVIGAIGVYDLHSVESSLFGFSNLGFKIRLDSISLTMYAVVSIIAMIVIKYSKNYLEGEQRKSEFIRRIATTVGFVLLFIISSNLLTMFVSWVAISLNLHRLILFYPERKRNWLLAENSLLQELVTLHF